MDGTNLFIMIFDNRKSVILLQVKKLPKEITSDVYRRLMSLCPIGHRTQDASLSSVGSGSHRHTTTTIHPRINTTECVSLDIVLKTYVEPRER